MIEIRNVQEKDYEQIKRLENAIFEFHRKHRPDYFREHADYTRKEFEELLKLPVFDGICSNFGRRNRGYLLWEN